MPPPSRTPTPRSPLHFALAAGLALAGLGLAALALSCGTRLDAQAAAREVGQTMAVARSGPGGVRPGASPELGSGGAGRPAAPGSRLEEARRLVSRLAATNQAGQVLLMGFKGRGEVSATSLDLVRGLGPGGVVLFGMNIPDQAADLGPGIAALQDAAASSAAGLPLLVAVDHEGGSVFRFRGGLTRLPPAQEIGNRGPAWSGLLGRRAGLELAALGVNLALAPVVELLDGENREVLGSRSFGSEAAQVDAAAGAFIEGLEGAGVAAAAKHFPGNGAVDPHASLPLLGADRAALSARYLPRFASAIGRGVSVVMLSHVLVPAIDPERPATLSPALVSGMLRGELGFRGLILTDDLYMKALSRRIAPERAAVEALAAGADLLMLSAEDRVAAVRDAIVRAVEDGRLPASRLADAAARVVELKLRLGLEAAFDSAARAARLSGLPAIVGESASRVAALAASAPARSAPRR